MSEPTKEEQRAESDPYKEQKGLTEQRPPCGYKGHTFLAVDTGVLYTDTGSEWVSSKSEGHEKAEKEAHEKAEKDLHEKAEREKAIRAKAEHATQG